MLACDAVQPNNQAAGANLCMNRPAVGITIYTATGETESLHQKIVCCGDVFVNKHRDNSGYHTESRV
jgi:hypothetical protein